MEILMLCIYIFFVRIFDVSLGTVRTITLIKGKSIIASIIGFIEVLIWFVIVKEALTSDINSIWIAIAYAGGFACGTIVGSFLSDKFIDGTFAVQVILSSADDIVVDSIRKAGYAVSVVDVKGKDSEIARYMLFIEINKKRMKHLKQYIKRLDNKAFIVVNETKMVQNGYFK